MIAFVVYMFFLGSVLGSFYLVVATRLPKGEDIVSSRSKCDSCNHTLKWYNLVPILSYIFQRGKCSYCGEKISSLNIIIEVATGLLFTFTYAYFGISYEFFMGLIISSLLIIIFISDFKYMIILDSPLVVSTILIVIVKLIYTGINSTIYSLVCGVALFCIMYLVMCLGNFLFKKDSLGGGDIKFAFLMGLCLDLRLGIIALILSAFLALPYAISVVYIKKSHEFPYGPFLIGALFIVFYNYDKFINLFEYLFPFI